MPRPLCWSAAFALAASSAVAAPPQPMVVTLSDGFTIRGQHTRETEGIVDPSSGRTITVSAIDAFDVVKTGPKYVIVSTHAKRGAKLDPAPLPELTTYKTELLTRYHNRLERIVWTKLPLPAFDDRWRRRVETRTDEGGLQYVNQQVTSLDPVTMLIESPVDHYSSSSYTTEEDPALIIDLLKKHRDLRDPKPGPVDPARRLKIADFLREIADADGTRRALLWTNAARQELERLKADVPPATWPKPVAEQAKKLADALSRTEAGVVVEELEAAVKSGRYDAARMFLKNFDPTALSEEQLTRLAVARAAVEAVKPGYEQTTTRLSQAIDRASGRVVQKFTGSVGGGPAAILTPLPKTSPQSQRLVAAAEQVLAEVSPDTAPRLELFKDAAGQAGAMQKPDPLLAYAVSGWARGRNGADADITAALRAWSVRELALDYLREPIANERAKRLDRFVSEQGGPPAPDELAQTLTLIPPVNPIDLTGRDWTPVPKARVGGVEGIVRVKGAPTFAVGAGVEYVMKLPLEYDHGRSYPVVIALPGGSLDAEKMVALLAEQAERNGYILVAPDWSNGQSLGNYDFSGKLHPYAIDTLRDVLRRTQADPDRVFLFGYASGADFAMDLGMAHPDLFAGVVGYGPYPPKNLAFEYWRNAQRLPMYLVTGESAGTYGNLTVLFKKWMNKGFPAILTLYRGRGLDWYAAETPTAFDWMNRKTRVRGAASLRLGNFRVEPWQVLRDTDDRYYWAGVAEGGLRRENQLDKGLTSKRLVPPAQFSADIGRNGTVAISESFGIRKFVIWLERDLIDLTRPVQVTVNGRSPPGYKPTALKPDIRLMLEEVYRSGDRKLLFLGKIEVVGPG